MDINKRKEEFSLAYVRAIAAAAGFGTRTPVPDDHSVDIEVNKISTDQSAEIIHPDPQGGIQAKCTAKDIIREEALHFLLRLKNYNDLRKRVMVPRILVVHSIPNEPSDWLRHSEEDLLLRHCSYWVSLKGMPPTTNTDFVTVLVPRANKFTPEALSGIMERIERDETL